MRIEKIVIHNYRQYENVEFVFPQKRQTDIHIVIGQNGLGKTNLLNAITWCLYDCEPHLGNKSSALPIINTKVLNSLVNGENCSVDVAIEATYNNNTIGFKRVVEYKKNDTIEEIVSKGKDIFEVFTIIDGETVYHEGDEAKSWINRLFPYGIMEFFFFDGEQLDNYFISDKRPRIEKTIYEISQVGLLNTISERLNSIINDIRKNIDKANPDLNPLFQELQKSKAARDGLEKDISICSEQISISEEIIARASELIRGQEDLIVLEKDKSQLDQQLKDVKELNKQKNKELADFIREYTIYINFYDKINKTLILINDKENSGKLPPNVDKNYIKKMLDKKTCLICKKTLDAEGFHALEELLSQLDLSSELSIILTKIKGPLEIIKEKTENYWMIRNKHYEELLILEKKEKDLEKSIIENNSRLANYGDKDTIRKAIIDRVENEKLRTDNIFKEGVYSEQLKSMSKKIEEQEDEYNKALEKSKGHKDLIKRKDFAEKANALAIKVKTTLMDDMRIETQEEMEELFLRLVWSRDKFKKVTLNENYSIKLLHADGYECLGACGAAERALLALSFTLALHKVSGFEAPLVIDTPVARISDKNRTNFAEILSEVSFGKQLILLFTPSEYSEEISSIFNNIYNSKVELSSVEVGKTIINKVV